MTSNLNHSEGPRSYYEDSIQNDEKLAKEYCTMQTKSCDANIDSLTQNIKTNTDRVSTSENRYPHQSTIAKLIDQAPYQFSSSVDGDFYNPYNLAKYMKNNTTKGFIRPQCDNHFGYYLRNRT